MTDTSKANYLELSEEDLEVVGDYTFKLEVQVHSPDALYAEAKRHKDGIDATHLKLDDGSVNIPDCLTMLLDPSTISGCEIYSSNANVSDADLFEYDVMMDVRVFDPRTLLKAAMNHPDAGGSNDGLVSGGSVNIDACLIMILDPGHLPGCSVHESSVTHGLD